MAGGIGGAGSAAGGFYAAAAAASETDGETFDNDTDFDDYDEWDYAEIVATVYVFAACISRHSKQYLTSEAALSPLHSRRLMAALDHCS